MDPKGLVAFYTFLRVRSNVSECLTENCVFPYIRHISFVNCTHKHLVSEVSVPDLHIHLARREKTCRGCQVNCEVKTLLRLQSVAKEKKG